MTKLAMTTVALLLSTSSALAEDSATASSAALALHVPSASGRGAEAQEETLFRGDFIEHQGWYVAPAIGVTTLDGDLVPSVGVRSAWTVNRRFGVGFAFNAFSNDANENVSRKERTEGGYGGLMLQYVVASNEWVHGFFDTTIGGGAVCKHDGSKTEHNGDCNDYGFFALEPMANVEFNLAPWARAALGGGYRFAVAEKESPLSNKDLGGFVVRTSVAFGSF